MEQTHSVAAKYSGGYDEERIETWLKELRSRLSSPEVTLGLIFVSPQLFEHASALLELVRVHGRVSLLAGCSSPGLISGETEHEGTAGFVLGLYWLPGARLTPARFTQEMLDEETGPAYWHAASGVNPDDTHGWLAFADPFRLDAENWLRAWNEAYPGTAIMGGLATGHADEPRTQIYLDGDVFEEGGVAISFAGGVRLQSVISQGCTPIGATWTITKAEGNLIHEIGSRPAYEVLVETVNSLPAKEQAKMRGNLFIGLVTNEYLEEFHRGDFLIRNVIGADPASGVIAVGALPRTGQTLQFQRRDAATATEDLHALLDRVQPVSGGAAIYGGCLCSCNGRGSHMFGRENHDAQLVQQRLGPLGLTGFFCNGEIGPVGDRNFLHGYTASLALFLPAK